MGSRLRGGLPTRGGCGFGCVSSTVERRQRHTGRCVLLFSTAADLTPRPVVPLRIGATPQRHVFDEAYTVAGHAATRGHPGRLQVRPVFEGGDAGLSGAKADTAVSAYLPLGPDIPLGKLLVRTGRWAVHACKGRAYDVLGAESGGRPPRFSGLLCEDRQALRGQVAGPKRPAGGQHEPRIAR